MFALFWHIHTHTHSTQTHTHTGTYEHTQMHTHTSSFSCMVNFLCSLIFLLYVSVCIFCVWMHLHVCVLLSVCAHTPTHLCMACARSVMKNLHLQLFSLTHERALHHGRPSPTLPQAILQVPFARAALLIINIFDFQYATYCLWLPTLWYSWRRHQTYGEAWIIQGSQECRRGVIPPWGAQHALGGWECETENMELTNTYIAPGRQGAQ